MKIYCVQMDVAWEEKGANFARVRGLLEGARVEAGSLVVLPEMFGTGFSMNVAGIAEEEAGETAAFLREVARAYGCFVVGGVVRRNAAGMGENRAVAVSPNGEVVADYAKVHPFSFGTESRHYVGGGRVATFAWGEATVMPSVCYDLRFPELYRAGVIAGATLMVVIANWPTVREEHWVTLLRARAIENQCYVAGCNRVGRDPGNAYGGRSLIVGPRGEIVADGGDREGVVEGVVDMEGVRAYRRAFPALADMRGLSQ